MFISLSAWIDSASDFLRSEYDATPSLMSPGWSPAADKVIRVAAAMAGVMIKDLRFIRVLLAVGVSR